MSIEDADLNAIEVNKLTKNKAFLRDLVKVHSMFKDMTSEQKQQIIDHHALAYNIEYLFESALAELGGYTRIDAFGYDFSDGSEAKTTSVSLKPCNTGGKTHKGKVTGVGHGASGGSKNGALRLAAYIAPRDEIRYYYLPKEYWSKLNTMVGSDGRKYIDFNYTWSTNSIPKFDHFRVPSLEALAKATG